MDRERGGSGDLPGIPVLGLGEVEGVPESDRVVSVTVG